MSESLRITLSGYYGCGNIGDEAVLAGILHGFRERCPGDAVEFTVLSANPSQTQRLHGVHALPRMSPTALRRALGDCHILISGGGSLFQDVTSLRSLLYYAFVVRYARQRRRPVMLYGQGVGPLRRSISRGIMRNVANRAAAITVRDEASAELLKQIGVRTPVEVTADPAFALPIGDGGPLLREFGLEERKILGFALRPWANVDARIPAFARMVEVAALRASAHPVFVPLHPPADLELAERIAQACQIPTTVIRRRLAPWEAIGLLAQVQAVGAMRLHAVIFAAMAGVPFLALAYDPKVQATAETLGVKDRCIPLQNFDGDLAGQLLAEAAEEGEGYREALRVRAGRLSALALRNVDIALEVAATTRKTHSQSW